ncbi:selenocysteine-specific translation elongation factor [Dictyobacter formicarum]|uniref:Selenocysteine-specific elongation factor n=1 Tax=Dictyobacter formicarum TaxID=2778368 RepID=A0ABQ3VL22_9CHLR|nr:selenocysteine-specific translation elongation factor [Dictyobacter formicarum]GHO86912.1 selenocysteine-specific translation factor [Dictyobacter formicarum]
MSCIGTAGHVDHGKSTLVKALTGIDPDRLTEEKERGMTIDLGFAWLKLPGGQEVSIVDVPGHESFIKNMLAGVGGIDAAMLVIAADEGIMPQTREHLAILDLLQVPRGVVVLTKADLVDEEWLELVREEITEYLKPTILAGAPILTVSAYTGQGLPELLTTLETLLETTSTRRNIGRPRLPIDRVFSLTGFGTIVTGTLLDGGLKVGQEVEIFPLGIKSRVRGLQMHKQQLESAHPGSRVALNLANVARTDLTRGNVVALSGQLQPTLLFDARLRLLADSSRSLLHNTSVDVYTGSQEIPARVRLLDTDELQPGQSAWVQMRLSRPAVVARRDRFILRIPSPGMTIGGGEIVDVTPRYHRRFQKPVLSTLVQLLQATPEELVLASLERRTPARAAGTTQATPGLAGYLLEDIAKQSNLAQDVTQQILESFLSEGRVYKVGAYWFAQTVWDALTDEALRLVKEFHQQYPLRSGISKEEWRARLGLQSRMAADVFFRLQEKGLLESVETRGGNERVVGSTLARTGGLIRIPGFQPHFTAVQQQQVDQLLQLFQEHPFTPPVRSEAEAMVGTNVVSALIEQGQLVKIGDGILFSHTAYRTALSKLAAYMHEHGKMTVAEARDVLETTRKYILPLLEHMDALRMTHRLGDERTPGTTHIGNPAE